MMKKIPTLLKIITLFSILILSSCSTDIEPYEGGIPNPDQTTPVDPVNPLLPTLSTATITNITSATAISGGTITADGGSAVTARGLVWGTAQNPTIVNSKTVDGTGIGSFSSSISGLSASTLYYVRAYATNANGTSYGNQLTFTTSNAVPSAFMSGIFNGVAMSNMRPAWYGGSFGGTEEVDVNYDYNYDRFLELQGNGLGGLQLSIWIPEVQWAVGTYQLFDHDVYTTPSSNAWLVQNLPAVSSTNIISGTITITEFSLVTKKIKGTFSFTYDNFMVAGGPNQGPYQVTNGTFDYKLNDPYFN